jgi:PilZ domain-containing protein
MMASMATEPSLRSAPSMGARPAQGKPTQERAIFRRWQRYRLSLPIRLIICRDESTRITDGRANDISEGGMLVFAGIELKSDDRVFIEFTPPYSGIPVRAPGVVRHRRGYNYGIEFMDETAAEQEQTEKLRNLLKLAAGR